MYLNFAIVEIAKDFIFVVNKMCILFHVYLISAKAEIKKDFLLFLFGDFLNIFGGVGEEDAV